MKLFQRTVALAAALGFLIAPAAFAQTPAPAAPAAPRKLISPFRGDATQDSGPRHDRSGGRDLSKARCRPKGLAGRVR